MNKVGSYYLLGSGRRVYVKDAAVYNTEDFAANTVNITDFQAYDSRTAMTVTPNWRIPYNVQLLPQKYYRDTLSGKPDYAVNRTGQTTEYVDLTFYYTTAVDVYKRQVRTQTTMACSSFQKIFKSRARGNKCLPAGHCFYSQPL